MNLELSRNGKLTPQQLRQQLQQGKLQICGGAVLLACRWSVWMHDGGDFVADRHRQAPSRSADRQFRFGSRTRQIRFSPWRSGRLDFAGESSRKYSDCGIGSADRVQTSCVRWSQR